MKISIGMASYNNPTEVWFTIQDIRLNHRDCSEILVVDNYGSDRVKKICSDCRATYHKYTDVTGTAMPRNKVFEFAKHEFVLCIDSHILLLPDSIKRLYDWINVFPEKTDNLIQGTMASSNLRDFFPRYDNEWRANMWGIWPRAYSVEDLPTEPNEIEMMAMGLFGCRKDKWLKFNENCQGFGGVEGIIHEKYRHAGRKVLNLPWLGWTHFFGREKVPYPLQMKDRIINFLHGFNEINLDPSPVLEHYGKDKVLKIAQEAGIELKNYNQ